MEFQPPGRLYAPPLLGPTCPSACEAEALHSQCPERVCPGSCGCREPSAPNPCSLFPAGTGCLVKAVETAAQREAFIVGKPNRFMFDCVASEFDVDPKRTIMVGDRLDTDILMGNDCHLTTLLTLTGVTTLDEVRGHQDSDCPARKRLVPDYYVDSIADLLQVLGE